MHIAKGTKARLRIGYRTSNESVIGMGRVSGSDFGIKQGSVTEPGGHPTCRSS
jgi:hypothetical protein